MRALCLCLLVNVACLASVAARNHAEGPPDGSSSRQVVPRVNAAREVATQAQVIAEAQRIRSTYGGVPPRGGGFDDAARRRANESYAWLARAGSRYRSDALVSDALMRTYGVMGDYYNGFYPAGAWRGYVGANQWARRRWLYDDRTSALQHDLDRYAQAWASVAYANGSWFWRPTGQDDQEAGAEAPGVRETALEPVPLPHVEESKLRPDQKEAWRDVRTQFVFVSSRVHDARVLLEGLAGRLSARGLSLNSKDGATALSMQGFLVDAADLIKDHEFARAKEALTRADYERTRLKGTTGQ
jgi:hypothetical protein